MVRYSVDIYFLVYTIIFTVSCAAKKEPCDGNCIQKGDCQFFGNLKNDEQTSWQNRFSCDSAKGDLVCCPENIWQVENSPQDKNDNSDDKVTIEKKSNFPYLPDYNNNYNYNNYPNNGPQNQYGNQYGNQNNNQYGNQNGNQYDDQYGNQYDQQNRNNNGGEQGADMTPYENTRGWQNRNRQTPSATTQNPYFMPANQNTGGSFNSPNLGGQCPVTSFPPDPNSGCCGREASEEDRISASDYPQSPMYNTQNNWMPQTKRPQSRWPIWMFSDSEESRDKRDTDAVVSIDNRIAGGRETELEQFPWTALLKTTFTFPDKEAAFSCGGSLVSSRYILTAGHCVYDKAGSIKGVEIYLAEYDKRTFPKDCKNVLGRGQQCIDNIVMEAESVHIHPQYDDDRLHNDIALIRLRGVAPYNDYVRPICLPPINVDSPDLSHLRLAVAGWGRNGQYKSDIKQSTVVNLIPNAECGESYPGITKKQLCAAGYSGEDTCKGDSGGPLMMIYGGKYYVSGVVSGKRADAPCGTSVPSLYTNVYQYLPWIRSIIRK